MLNKIKVDNFKAFKHLEYNCAGLNLLTGMNGAGKSSFVQLLRLMSNVSSKIGRPLADVSYNDLGSKSLDELRYCYSQAKPSFDVIFSGRDGNEQYRLVRQLADGGLGANAQFLKVSRLDYEEVTINEGTFALNELFASGADRDTTVCDKELEFARQLEKEEADRIKQDVARMIEEDSAAAESFHDLWRCSRFVDAFRIKPTEIHKGGVYNWAQFIFEENPEVAYNPEGQNAIEFLYHSGILEEKNLLMDKVNACLQWVSPGAHLEIMEQKVGDDIEYLTFVSYGIRGENRQFKPQNVGFGISYILPILVTLLSARAGNILIIENPEAHLHPRGQSEIGKLIAETVARGVQVFVETHSDHVINGIRVAVKKGAVRPEDVNIAFFERKPHGKEVYTEVTNIKVDANGSLSEYPKDFMDEWALQQVRLMQ